MYQSFSMFCVLVGQLEELLNRMNLLSSQLPDQIYVLDASLEGNDDRPIGDVWDRITLVAEPSDEVPKRFVFALVQLMKIVFCSQTLERTLEVGDELCLQLAP